MPDMAWDIEPRKDVKLFVGCPIIPSFQYIHTRVQEAWEHAWKPPQTVRVFERSFGIASAREKLADTFLEGDWTHLIFLDSDIMLKNDNIKRLIEVDKTVVCGLYYESSDRRHPEAFRHSQRGWTRDPPIDFKPHEYFEFPDESEDFFLAGLGLLMLKREVFEKIEKPYFLYSSEYESKIKNDFWTVCVVPQQIVYSEIPKNIEELEIGDNVLAEDGKFHPIANIQKRDWYGDVIKITPRTMRLPIVVTPQHKMPIYREGKQIEVMASEINPKTDSLFIAAPKEIEDTTSFNLKYRFLSNRVRKIKNLPKKIDVDARFLEFLGKFVADGCVCYSHYGEMGETQQISIAFNDKTERDRMDYYRLYLNKITNKTFGNEIRQRGEKNHYSASVRGSCIPLSRFLGEWFGRGATHKYLPSWIIKLPPERLISFIRGVWEGDGFATYSGVKKLPIYAINLSSEKLILGIALCLLKIGIKFRINEHIQPKEAFGAGNKFWRIVISTDRDKFHEMMTGNIEKTRDVAKHQHTEWRNNHLIYKINKVDIIPYRGDVWDIEVEDNHTFQLRATCSRNSEDFYFLLRLQQAGIKITYVPDILAGHIGNAIVWGPNQINFL